MESERLEQVEERRADKSRPTRHEKCHLHQFSISASPVRPLSGHPRPPPARVPYGALPRPPLPALPGAGPGAGMTGCSALHTCLAVTRRCSMTSVAISASTQTSLPTAHLRRHASLWRFSEVPQVRHVRLCR